MKLAINNHSIKAISVVLPKNPRTYEEELNFVNLSENKFKILQQNSGIFNHFISDENTYASDLASKALEELLNQNLIKKDEIDVLIFASFTPDFLAPACSSLVHKNLKLANHTLCFDISVFCWGFLQGLLRAFLLLDHLNIKKVVLLCASVKSKKINPKDKITFLNTSDSASAILIEKTNTKQKAFYSQNIFSEFALEETLPLKAFNENGNDFMKTDGNLFFSFIMEKFPIFFEDFFSHFKQKKQEIDYFLFQNANSFVRDKLFYTLKLKNNFDDSLKEYGNTLINKLVLDLICLQKQLEREGGGD
ncbi:3-oxoacyl-ACP synthase [Campylobacter sp. TTU_617]|uniref:3-oxoacyl-ACP synthase n=1 Tax=Campylobacter sp. TTU_617 TaxID=2768148 RepID=UPI001906F210|nr:3-oxoacyl-ACP synthase [Campylobacter sp. TTU_617]MBK1972446.1 3-oxoacyl-ACP synthase [Campylobacter sp. TTU_617]